METQPYDVIETTINLDAQLKVLLGYSNHPATIKQWLRDFPSYCKLATDGYSVEMNGVPLAEIRKIKVMPKAKTNLSDEQREVRRLRGIELSKTRVKTTMFL